jgi:hypothetical protein
MIIRLVSNELERTGNEAVTAYLKILVYCYLPVGNEENHKISQDRQSLSLILRSSSTTHSSAMFDITVKSLRVCVFQGHINTLCVIRSNPK